ncbi:MAG: hypothetical protein WKI04_05715 [Ferruginibacter sp.]
MKSKLMLAVVILLSVLNINASAQNNRGLRDENQRIRHGVRNGELNARETYTLSRQKQHLRMEAMRYKKNDGHISRRERAELRRDNKRLSRNIYRQKHDRQRRF